MGMTKNHDLRAAKLPCHIFFVMCHKELHSFNPEMKGLCDPGRPFSVIIATYNINRSKTAKFIKKFRPGHITRMKNAVTCFEDFQNLRP